MAPPVRRPHRLRVAWLYALAIAQKIRNAFDIDEAFSAEALAAPLIAAKALGEAPRPVLGS